MKCKRKMQKRRDVLTVIGMMILLAFILRMWPLSSRLRLRFWRCLRLRRRSRC